MFYDLYGQQLHCGYCAYDNKTFKPSNTIIVEKHGCCTHCRQRALSLKHIINKNIWKIVLIEIVVIIPPTICYMFN